MRRRRQAACEYSAQRSACHCARCPRRCTGSQATPRHVGDAKRSSIQRRGRSRPQIRRAGCAIAARPAGLSAQTSAVPAQVRPQRLDSASGQPERDQRHDAPARARPEPATRRLAPSEPARHRRPQPATDERADDAAPDAEAAQLRPRTTAERARMQPRGRRGSRQTRLKTSVPLVPPKPKLFLTAYSIFMSRAVLAQ